MDEQTAILEATLECVAQPVWVVDGDGLIAFANPAALSALGYDSLEQLRGRPGHQMVHYKRPDGSPYPVAECPTTRSRLFGETLEVAEDWFVRRDGSMLTVSYSTAPLDTAAGRGAVIAFTDVEERRRVEAALRARDMARRVMEAADAERRRVARDLHDGAQQEFVNASITLQIAEQTWASDPARARELLAAATQRLQVGIVSLRELAAGLHPPILASRGLGAALESLAERAPLPVRIVALPGRRLPQAVEASIYYLVSEALTNVFKHASAASAFVRFEEGAGRLIVEVGDDGIGGASVGSGSGLPGLADRVAALEGSFEVDSPAGAGTKLRADIPLPG